MLLSIINSELFSWVILPILIFLARIIDVSFSTLRIVFLGRGQKLLASSFGFVEVIIWLVAMTQIMQNLDNVFCYLAYGLGFAAGTYIGMKIEEKLAIGVQVVRIFLPKDGDKLKQALHKAGFGYTLVDAEGATGKVKIIYTIVRRKDVPKVTELIAQHHSKAFYSIEDLITVKEGIFPPSKTMIRRKQ
jgi:uncharacterized protein YebE (UPF0316 family)